MTQRVSWLDRTLIVAPLYIGFCVSEAAYLREMKKRGVANAPAWIPSPQSDACVHFVDRDGGRHELALVCLRETERSTGIGIAALLVHEAVHIWQRCKERIGERDPSAEFEAYSIQAISQQLMQAYLDATAPKAKP